MQARTVERSGRPSIKPGVLDALEKNSLALEAVRLEQGLIDPELGLLSRLTPTAPVAEKDRPGAAPLATETWEAVFAFVERRRAARTARWRALYAEGDGLERARRVLLQELQGYNAGAFSSRRLQVVVVLDRQADAGRLEVSYALGGASWTPGVPHRAVAGGGPPDP
ncbi:MAG: hypothetical protein R3F43_30475 [bacterium]